MRCLLMLCPVTLSIGIFVLGETSQAVDVKSTNQHAGYGLKSGVDLADMEKAQPLSEHPLAIDAVS